MKFNNDILDDNTRIHFIGIGGSGMCPMAEILYDEGFEITGSDIYESDTLQRVKDKGIKVFMNHDEKNIAIAGAELITYSAAIKSDNPELIAAKKAGIPTIERSVMLGLVASRYRNSVAISGTHGKTTTTSMLTQIMIESGKDPSAVIGGKLNLINSNSCVGKSDIIICEACEYVNSFLQLKPAIGVILNVDSDHLDYFGNLDNIKKAFNNFAKKVTNKLIINGDDANTLNCLNNINIPIIKFGFNKENDYYATNINCSSNAEFTLMHKNTKLADIKLKVPGEHNIKNALAASAVAHIMNVSASQIAKSIANFKGVHRRFEMLGVVNNITVADDFAHHPTELRAVITAAKNMKFNKVWAVFQPHTYSRTSMLINDFAEALSLADRVVLSEILPVRETNIYNICTKDLADKIPGSVWFKTFEEITEYIINNAKPQDLILTIGGGNVYKCANMILDKLKNNI